jgi:hypothetical protein
MPRPAPGSGEWPEVRKEVVVSSSRALRSPKLLLPLICIPARTTFWVAPLSSGAACGSYIGQAAVYQHPVFEEA